MNVDERVGQNIRKYRMAYNMTLKELAVLLHKSVSTVSKYEKEIFHWICRHLWSCHGS